MKEILCVVDFSEASEKVLGAAADLATASKAHLIVLFPYRLLDQDHGGDMNALKKRLDSEATRKFQDLKKTLPRLEKVIPEFHSEIGFVVGRINAYLAKNKIDIVIIGEHPVKERNNQINGELEKLISTSRIPFIIVPPKVSAETSVQRFETS
jgi:nucleotide-binding universal stress UspA family protein